MQDEELERVFGGDWEPTPGALHLPVVDSAEAAGSAPLSPLTPPPNLLVSV